MLVKIDNYLPKNGDNTIEKNIISGLKNSSKMISCIFFYDQKGSKLFEKITKLPEYYLTRTEIPLLKKAANQLSNKLKGFNIIEFGSGDCTKVSVLLDAISEKYRDSICYIPFDVSIEAVKKSSNILNEKYPGLKICGIVADFMTQYKTIPKESKKLICFLGSTIGNLSMEKSQDFLVNISRILNSGDLLLIGFDMVKNKEILERAYNDSLHVTEKFNKNILNVVNSHLKSDLNPDNFEHVAFYNEELSRIEMHLKAIRDIEVFCSNSLINITIKKGESIHTENSYKFTEENIYDLAECANLEIQNIYNDEKKWFSLVLLMKK